MRSALTLIDRTHSSSTSEGYPMSTRQGPQEQVSVEGSQ